MIKALRRLMDRLHPLFAKGGPYEQFYVVYEMIDGILFTPSEVTRGAPHVRDAVDLKRVMTYVVLGVTPCILVALYNTGYQANLAMQSLGVKSLEGWRGEILGILGIEYDPSSLWSCTWHGMLYFFPIYLVTLLVGGLWEVCVCGGPKS